MRSLDSERQETGDRSSQQADDDEGEAKGSELSTLVQIILSGGWRYGIWMVFKGLSE